jgi:lipopolysaccharide export system protein LptA
MIRPARALGCAALAILVSGIPARVDAQGLNLGSGDTDAPIEVYADNGIEWQQDNEVLIARGNARAVRAGVNVYGDVLRAYYRKEDKGGGSQLTRLDAAGKVRIVSPGESIDGDGAVYDLDKAILVVNGKKVTYRSGEDVITAEQQMEYYERDLKAVARGNASALHDGKKVNAKLIQAQFYKTKADKTEVREVQAFDDVVIVTEQDVVRSDKAIYNVLTEMATLTGNVRITRGANVLTGDAAEVNMKTGVSRLLASPGGKSGGRVQGLITPQKREPSAKPNTAKGAKPK